MDSTHPVELIIGDPAVGVLTRAQQKEREGNLRVNADFYMYHCFLSKLEPFNVQVALEHAEWVEAM